MPRDTAILALGEVYLITEQMNQLLHSGQQPDQQFVNLVVAKLREGIVALAELEVMDAD